MAGVLREREEGNQLWKIVGFRRQLLNIRAPIPSLHNVFLFYSLFLQYRVSTAHMALYKDLKGSLETFTDERTHINLPLTVTKRHLLFSRHKCIQEILSLHFYKSFPHIMS